VRGDRRRASMAGVGEDEDVAVDLGLLPSIHRTRSYRGPGRRHWRAQSDAGLAGATDSTAAFVARFGTEMRKKSSREGRG
jgi:hypothetical protein